MRSQQTAPGKFFEDPYDFSLVLGGPLYQLYRRAHLTGTALELLRRRVLVICLFAWLPLLVLSVFEGHAWGRGVQVPFLWDLNTQVRFLVAMPLFIIAELTVHQQMRPAIRQFIDRGIISEEARPGFDAALSSALRLRNSMVAELLLLAIVYLVGVLVIWPTLGALNVTTWYARPSNDERNPTLAGWWFLAVSLPFFQFILLRWYFRLFIWTRFLWRVARLDLKLVPTHPDQAGGLGFLGLTLIALIPLLLGQSALVAGTMANRILFEQSKLLQFKFELLFDAAFLLLLVLGPLLVFIPKLERARRAGLREYGAVASRYVSEFDQKWLHGGAPPDEPLLGTQDLQALADLGNSFDRVREMRFVPFGKDILVRIIVAILLPLLPLTLTMFSFEELLGRLLKIIF